METTSLLRLGWFAVLFCLLAPAAKAGTSVEWGRDYVPTQTSIPAEQREKIEVQEFFWYGCPHCYHLEPTLNQWLKSLPKDVHFKRTPAMLNDSWARVARIYFAEQRMGVTLQLHSRVFDAIARDRLQLENRQEVADWIRQQGIDSVRFMQIYDSAAVSNDIRRAKITGDAAGISGVPAIMVDGQYLTSPSMTGDYAHFFAVINELIEKARKERQKTKNAAIEQ